MELMRFDSNLNVTKEWYNFVFKGIIPTNGVSKNVLNSWERSKEMKIDPYGGRSNIILTPEKLKKKLDDNRIVIKASESCIEEICSNMLPNGYIVFLTDNEGNILLVDGDKNTIKEFSDDINFFVGASWSEEAVGTTAVSLVVSTNKPIPFFSQQKYCYELKKRACTAVPINTPDQEIIAILGIAANSSNPDQRLFNILILAKKIIESTIEAKFLNQEINIISSCYTKMLSSVSDPIIMIDNDGVIVEFNDKVLDIVGKTNKNIKGLRAVDILGFNPMMFKSSNAHLVNSNIGIRKIIPIYDNFNNLRLGIGFLEDMKTKNENKSSQIRKTTKFSFEDIIGTSDVIVKTKKLCMTAAQSDFNVLIQGESGTGKELFAQAIHSVSHRSCGPFIAINCGAIPENLIESELFGYEKGAFTGASKEGKIGKFELANGGTIFLDEIGDMPKNLQTTLLRVLQEKEVTKIGAYTPVAVDIRVIAATNKNLYKEVEKGNFREDLFWRLNVIPIGIPTLKERQDDIIELMEYFMAKYDNIKESIPKLHKSTKKILKEYQWPGNVRELENVTKRLLVFVEEDVILPEHLPEYIINSQGNACKLGKSTMDDFQKRIIQKTLEETDHNISEAARRLGISRNTIYNKITVDKNNNC